MDEVLSPLADEVPEDSEGRGRRVTRARVVALLIGGGIAQNAAYDLTLHLVGSPLTMVDL